jgi:hypothetical protein
MSANFGQLLTELKHLNDLEVVCRCTTCDAEFLRINVEDFISKHNMSFIDKWLIKAAYHWINSDLEHVITFHVDKHPELIFNFSQPWHDALVREPSYAISREAAIKAMKNELDNAFHNAVKHSLI